MHRSKRRAQMDDLFDHLVGEREHLRGNGEAECLRDLEVDDRLVLAVRERLGRSASSLELH
jgi:hypothetical protein